MVEHLTCNEAVIGSIPIAGYFTVHTSIAVVVHNSAGALRLCLEGLRREPPSKAFELLVVDAGSSEDLAAVRAAHPDAQWISMENRGYAAAVNTALARARGTHFVFANADARLTGPVIDALVDELRARQIGLVAPHVRSGGETRSPLRPAPSLGRDAVAAVVPVRWRAGVRKALEIGEAPPSLDGPCHAMRAADLRALGGLDESFFLYFEETHLAQRVRAAGLELAAVEAVLDHEGGASAADPGWLRRLFHRSRMRYAQLTGGTPAALALAALSVAGGVFYGAAHRLVGRPEAARACVDRAAGAGWWLVDTVLRRRVKPIHREPSGGHQRTIN